eukprot:Skav219012  [mRNA]  locus=scaffold2640:48662:49294:+ [translate_table: standard]
MVHLLALEVMTIDDMVSTMQGGILFVQATGGACDRGGQFYQPLIQQFSSSNSRVHCSSLFTTLESASTQHQHQPVQACQSPDLTQISISPVNPCSATPEPLARSVAPVVGRPHPSPPRSSPGCGDPGGVLRAEQSAPALEPTARGHLGRLPGHAAPPAPRGRGPSAVQRAAPGERRAVAQDQQMVREARDQGRLGRGWLGGGGEVPGENS